MKQSISLLLCIISLIATSCIYTQTRIAKKPTVDLRAYSILCIEDVTWTVPQRSARMDSWTGRPNALADDVARLLGPLASRGTAPCAEGAVILRLEIIRYTKTVYFTNWNIDFKVSLIESGTNEDITTFTVTRDINLQQRRVASVQNELARDLADYLRRCIRLGT
jgi:hypothetical protein